MKLIAPLASLAALLAAGCAGSPSTQQAGGPVVEVVPGAGVTSSQPAALLVADASATDLDKKICRQLDPFTGSRVGGRRLCLTAAEWELRENNSREFAKEAGTNGRWNLQSGD